MLEYYKQQMSLFEVKTTQVCHTPCAHDETKNLLGPHQCLQCEDCTGNRVCGSDKLCVGDSGCSPFNL